MKTIRTKLLSYYSNNKSIYDLSWKLHLLFITIMVLHILVITPYRYLYFPKLITYINRFIIFIYGASKNHNVLGKKNLSVYISSFAIPLLYSVIIFIYNLSLSSTLWFLLAFMIIYLILLRKDKPRIIYVTYCVSVFLLPGIIMGYDFPENIIKIIQIAALVFVPIMISAFIEMQEAKLLSLNNELEIKYGEKKRLTVDLAGKNQDLVTFSHIMSHDLKAPLRSIISFSKLIEKSDIEMDKKNSTYFTIIKDAANSMDNLITELLSFTKIDQGKITFKDVNLTEVISEIQLLYQQDINDDKKKLLFSNLPFIAGDHIMVKILFQNLIANAYNYQPKNVPSHIPTVCITAAEDKANIVFYIKDNGIGISDDYQEKLYTPFERYHNAADYNGTGLGLSICKKVLDKHNATITLEETSSLGSTFKLVFKRSGVDRSME